MDEVSKDARFSHILKDPRFKKIPKKQVKVKIDKRFQSMFNEKKFQIKYNVDKRGRKVKLGGSEDLKRYYDLSDNEESEEKSDEEEEEKPEKKSENKSEEGEDSEDDSDEEEKSESSEKDESVKQENLKVIKVSEKDRKTLTPEIKKKLKDLTIDYARGEGAIYSDSSSDDDSSDSGDEDFVEFSHDWGELDKDADRTDESTHRLAVCNMNWDRIEAADLMVLFNSFLPPGGLIHSVTIYPSEFGLERMKEEEEKGPMELTEGLPEGEEGKMSQIQMEKLRTYQLNRLKYYYAVVVCDSAETADVLYKECDGLEYESSSSKLDLRFIPDDTTFDQEPRETCDALPDLSSYKPKLFMTSALTKAKCDLTWDENDPKREEIVKSTHSGNIDENHLKKYLACSSSDESEAEENDVEEKVDTSNLGEIDKYKALLAEIENKEKTNKKNEVNLEVSWNLKLENKASEVVKEAAKEKEKKTPFQQYLEKKKEKKKKKREEKKAQLEEENRGSGDSAFSDDDIPSDIDMNDPYFREEFEDLKPKKSSKGKKYKKEDEVEDEESKQKKAELELLLLDNEPENLKHFSLKKIEESEKESKKIKKGKKRKAEEANNFQDDFKIDVNDERFSALYTSHHFNIDPADPQFKPTKATKELIEEKLRRRETEEVKSGEKLSQKQETNIVNKPKNAELSVLVKNIKKNTSEVCKKARRQ